jgi:hypothetical protein
MKLFARRWVLNLLLLCNPATYRGYDIVAQFALSRILSMC